MKRNGRWLVLAVAMVLVGLAPSAATARGTLKGTYGNVRMKAKGLKVACAYNRSLGFFTMSAGSGGAKKQKGTALAGFGADPSAPGVAFPIVLTDTTASFVYGAGVAPPLWGSTPGSVVVTLTGFRKNKMIGTMTGTLEPTPGFGSGGEGPIQVNVNFAGKCLVQ